MAKEHFYIENLLPDSPEPKPDRWQGFKEWIEIEDDAEGIEAEAEEEPLEPRGKHSAARVRQALDAQVADVSSRRGDLESDKERIVRKATANVPSASDYDAHGEDDGSIDLDSYESIEELESYWRKRRRSRSEGAGSDTRSVRSDSKKTETADRARKGGEAQAALARAKAKAAAERKESSLASKIVLGILGIVAAPEAIRNDVDAIEKATADLKSKMSGPIWRAFSKLPNIAIDMANVEVLVDVVDDITQSGLRPLADNSSILSMSSLLESGDVNVEALASVTDILGGLGD